MAKPVAPRTFEEALTYLEPRQKKFVELYLMHPDAKAAAIGAGYSQDVNIDYKQILRGAYISTAIRLGFALALSAEEVRARIEDIASASLADFLTISKVRYLEESSYDVDDALDLITDLIIEEKEKKVSSRRELRRLERLRRKCVRLIDEIQLGKLEKKKVNKTILLEIEWKDKVKVEVDLAKAERLGKLHQLKKFKQGKYGPEIELHSPTWALEALGKHHQLFEAQESGVIDMQITTTIVKGGAK